MSSDLVAGHYDEAWREDVVPPHTAALFPLLRELGLGPGSKVLDLGCGNGVLGQWLVTNLGCEVRGSEISEVAAAQARERGYAAVANHSLETDESPFPGERFDVVVLCAIVEHLFAPEKAIRQAHASLRDGGTLIVLTPNVTWVVNRLLFLFGHWESSLLGGTTGHIRYLNQTMLARLLLESGFHDLDWSHSISLVLPPGNRAFFRGRSFRVPGFLVGRRVSLRPSLWAENFIVLARRAAEHPLQGRPAPPRPASPSRHWSLDDSSGELVEPRFRGNRPLLAYLLGVVGLVALAACSRMLLASASPAALALFPVSLAAVAAWAGMLAARNRGARSHTRAFVARSLEVAVALPAFLVLAPLLLMLGLGCRLTTGSSHVGVIREGRSGQPFLRLALYTFPKGQQQPGRVGRWLETLRIADLPALLNVLRGRIGLRELLRRER